MTFALYFMSIFKDTDKANSCKDKPKLNPSILVTIEASPRTKEKLRKVQSEEDFMKVQVPWIL